MTRVRQAQKCTASAGRRRDPETGERLPCEAYAVEGLTVCSAHGGSTTRARAAARRNVLKAKAEKSALRLLGDPAEQRDPAEYLLEALYRAATLEQVLAEEIAERDPDRPAQALLEEHGNDDGSSHTRVHPLVRLWTEALDRKAKIAALAIQAGIAERHVQLAEQQAVLLAETIRAGIDDPDLGLDYATRQRLRVVFARHLRTQQNIPTLEIEAP